MKIVMSEETAKKHGLSKKATKKRKYGNRFVYMDGLRFDSALEAKVYSQLKVLERSGEISNLLADKAGLRYNVEINGKKITRYTLDFSFYDEKKKRQRYIDVKSKWSMKNMASGALQAYRIRKKLVEAIWEIEIEEWAGVEL